ncbi:MAG TPA: single-stranded DNA-binding protein [Nonomuraea sp.]|nr:single-stranded DNA-binding protein [Nonomuraea sp.]
MAAGDTVITVVGNLVDDPELRFTPTGQAVARFRIASTPRFMDRQSNEWKDGDSLYLTGNAWRQLAENVAETVQRGMRVIVQGRLRQRTYETQDGDKRTVYEIEVDEIGPSLRYATAKVLKVRGNRTANTPPQQDPWADYATSRTDQDTGQNAGQTPGGDPAPAMAGSDTPDF